MQISELQRSKLKFIVDAIETSKNANFPNEAIMRNILISSLAIFQSLHANEIILDIRYIDEGYIQNGYYQDTIESTQGCISLIQDLVKGRNRYHNIAEYIHDAALYIIRTY